MIVKVAHIEVVLDLSINAFIAALHQFVSHSGLPSDIFSDCGTNFQGANRELRLIVDSNIREIFAEAVSCQWHFNPPTSPNFGTL